MTRWNFIKSLLYLYVYVFHRSQDQTNGLYMSLYFIPLLLIPGFCSINNEQQIIFSFTL